MTKENLQPISELMTSALAPIHTHLNQMDKRLDAIETRLDSMAEDITAIKEDRMQHPDQMERAHKCRGAGAGAVLKPQGGNCAVLP